MWQWSSLWRQKSPRGRGTVSGDIGGCDALQRGQIDAGRLHISHAQDAGPTCRRAGAATLALGNWGAWPTLTGAHRGRISAPHTVQFGTQTPGPDSLGSSCSSAPHQLVTLGEVTWLLGASVSPPKQA